MDSLWQEGSVECYIPRSRYAASARNLQASIVQGTLLYAAELTWNGRKGMEGEY